MTLFRNKYRELAAVLQSDLDDARKLLEIERTKRIAAETLSQERLSQVGKAYELLFAANAARDEAVSARMKSVDLVNTTLLGAMGPEKPPTKSITEYRPVQKQHQAVAESRKADRMFANALLNMQKRKPQRVPEVPTDVIAS